MKRLPRDLDAQIARLRELGVIRAADIEVEALIGLTNRSYRVSTPESTVVVRLAGAGAGSTIDRHAEAHNARLAANLGIGPEVLVVEPESGLMITRYVEYAPFAPSLGSLNGTALTRAARSLRRLHGSGLTFSGTTNLRDELQSHAQRVRSRHPDPDRTFELAARIALDAAEQLAQAHPRLVPCHNDPSPDNARGSTSVVWLDWEYASMNDPAWDVAYFELAANLTPKSCEAWRRAHYGRAPTSGEAARLGRYRVALDVLVALWTILQPAETGDALGIPVEAATRLARVVRARPVA